MWECAECGYKYNENDKAESCWACKAPRQEKAAKPVAAAPVERMPVKPAKHKSSRGLIAAIIAVSVLFTVIICFIVFNILYRGKDGVNTEKAVAVQVIKEPVSAPAEPQPAMKEKSAPPAPDNSPKPPTPQPARPSDAEIQEKANAALMRQTGIPPSSSSSGSGATRKSISDQDIARKAEASLARNLAQMGRSR